jgi:hypothetical protein
LVEIALSLGESGLGLFERRRLLKQSRKDAIDIPLRIAFEKIGENLRGGLFQRFR